MRSRWAPVLGRVLDAVCYLVATLAVREVPGSPAPRAVVVVPPPHLSTDLPEQNFGWLVPGDWSLAVFEDKGA